MLQHLYQAGTGTGDKVGRRLPHAVNEEQLKIRVVGLAFKQGGAESTQVCFSEPALLSPPRIPIIHASQPRKRKLTHRSSGALHKPQ